MELRQGTLWLGVLPREDGPFSGEYALPGGFVHTDEDADTKATALRVIREKTEIVDVFCEQLGTFSGANRDPRGWSATVVYYALIRGKHTAETALTWMPIDALKTLAFDHNAIVQAAMERIRAKGNWSNLPAFLLPATFTFSELRQTYELVLKINLNDSAFRRKIEEMGLIEPIVGQKSKLTARPAQLFKLKRDAILSFDRRI
ncbi:MAG: NUDIX hydrolase [Hyphomicrobiales bacterium]|nr:NUDIX hydrolase [Hyphomicrobiales bacterium]